MTTIFLATFSDINTKLNLYNYLYIMFSLHKEYSTPSHSIVKIKYVKRVM